MRLPLLILFLSMSSITALGRSSDDTLTIQTANGLLHVRAVAQNVLRLDFAPNGYKGTEAPTEIMDLRGLRNGRVRDDVVGTTLLTERLAAQPKGDSLQIEAENGATELLVSFNGGITVRHDPNENLYGMRGIGLHNADQTKEDLAEGFVRSAGAEVKAGSQGDGGAPLAYSTSWGLLVDSVDGRFDNLAGNLTFSNGSRKTIEAYIVIGPPEETIKATTLLTGRPPMPPKWALGFLNSQWGSSEKEVKDIVAEYRQKQIPLDAFIMDFDFKAWGEDNYGEWRWNSTNGPGNVEPMKYPDGASGLFGKEMLAQGVHLAGIMKPRILTQNVQLQPTKAAAEATAHNWWLPGEKPYKDYFSGRLAADLDFSKADLRRWYWEHSRPLFETGIAGWWNDEADEGFDSLGFMHMQQSLDDGQRSASNQRVWSINRNFYLGAQKFAFGTWSGDIRTGFPSMSLQRLRMIATLNLGQSHWSMDSGGFHGHPTPENYARWIEFASAVPIMRVHNTFGEHRQPWVYGPIAEAAAKKAIDFRYSLFPSLYSWERNAYETGAGIARPLFWEFPGDSNCANDWDAWMLGDSLLVSPVADEGATTQTVYLPSGRWFRYGTDEPFAGGNRVIIPVDSAGWSDLPIFVRGGSILATQPVEQYAGEKKITEITLDVWPDRDRVASFNIYDDDGDTYRYEKGDFFSQKVRAAMAGGRVDITFDRPSGGYGTPIRTFRVRIHGFHGSGTVNGAPVTVPAGKNYLETVVSAGKEMELQIGT